MAVSTIFGNTSGGFKQKKKGEKVSKTNTMGEKKEQHLDSEFNMASLNVNESIRKEGNVESKNPVEQKVVLDPVVPVIAPDNTMSATTTTTPPPTKPAETPLVATTTTATVTPILDTTVKITPPETIETVHKEKVTTTSKKNTSNHNPMEAVGKFVQDTTHGIMDNFHKLQDSIQSIFGGGGGGSSATTTKNTRIQKKKNKWNQYPFLLPLNNLTS